MSCSSATAAVERLGGEASLAKLLPRAVDRIDSFRVPGARHLRGGGRLLWGWRSSACGGLRDKKWKPSNGGAMREVLIGEVGRLKSIGVQHAGGVAIDIGAHMGDSTLPMALLVNETIAFEPNPLVYQNLAVNARLNPSLNIRTHNVGVADRHGSIAFSYGGSEPCNGGVAGKGALGGHIVQLPVAPLEDFLVREHGAAILERITYIKTDAEGFDSSIVKSMYPLISKICRLSRCPTLQVEWFDNFASGPLPSTVSEGSRSLFDVLEALPHGPWELLCTSQSNAPGAAPGELSPILSPQKQYHCKDIIVRNRGGAVRGGRGSRAPYSGLAIRCLAFATAALATTSWLLVGCTRSERAQSGPTPCSSGGGWRVVRDALI
jgi:FkbM family methyltransferase